MLGHAQPCGVKNVEDNGVAADADAHSIKPAHEPVDDEALAVSQEPRDVLDEECPRFWLADDAYSLEEQLERWMRGVPRTVDRKALAGWPREDDVDGRAGGVGEPGGAELRASVVETSIVGWFARYVATASVSVSTAAATANPAARKPFR